MKCIKSIIIVITILTLQKNFSQVGSVNVIDSSPSSAGVTKFQSADLDNDNDFEVIASFTGSQGRIAYYNNQSAASFSSMNIIDPLSFSKGIATGDFNGDNWTDLVAIGGTDMEARIYFNNNGLFDTITHLDSNISIQVNDVIVADFDSNNSEDIVIIGQHSIDFYRNNGVGVFAKETILSTSISPLSLECLDIAAVDVDGDNDMDIVCGETEGLVVYINNGNAVFTPHYYSSISEILLLVHPVDIDGDDDMDVVAKNNAGEIKWFSNDGNGVMNYEATLSSMPSITSLNSIDYNNDGLDDLYVSYLHNISIFENDASHSFITENNIFNDNNLLMGPVEATNIDNNEVLDYLWSGGNNKVAYHINQTPLSIDTFEKSQTISVYPNPTHNLIHIISKYPLEEVNILDVNGKLICFSSNDKIDLSHFDDGLYFLKVNVNGKTVVEKIIKN